MLRGYFDDSDIGQTGPIYVLAGWIAPAAKWTAFSDEWLAILEMKPRVSYFKFSEARSLKGEFDGISAESRDEKLKLLLRIIEDHKLVGVSASVDRDVFEKWLGSFRFSPYVILFHRLLRRILTYFMEHNIHEKIDIVFDSQPGQSKIVINVWDDMLRSVPSYFAQQISGPPSFKDDKLILPLQAADFHAGWLRTMNAAQLAGEAIPAPLGWRVATRLGDIIIICILTKRSKSLGR